MLRNTWSTFVGAAAILLVASAANAQEVRVKCEQRLDKDGVAERTKISVDAKDLADGIYTVTVSSASMVSVGGLVPFGDEIEVDFDSNPNDVAAGATAIEPDFVKDGRLSVRVDPGVAEGDVDCPAR